MSYLLHYQSVTFPAELKIHVYFLDADIWQKKREMCVTCFVKDGRGSGRGGPSLQQALELCHACPCKQESLQQTVISKSDQPVPSFRALSGRCLGRAVSLQRHWVRRQCWAWSRIFLVPLTVCDALEKGLILLQDPSLVRSQAEQVCAACELEGAGICLLEN